jgi:FkbM family methyltransferase
MLLDFENLLRKYDMRISGVLHVGAHFGEEYLSYIDNGISRVVFIEPLKENFQVLEDRFGAIDDVVLINKGAGSEKKQLNMYRASNDLVSSSVLKPKRHLTQHPDVLFDDGQTVIEIDRIDNMLKDIVPYNFMNVDVQGYELEVFKGAGEFLDRVDFIMTEVNRDEVYEGCAQVEEIDEYLSKYKFKRTETSWDGDCWGDALYVKEYRL